MRYRAFVRMMVMRFGRDRWNEHVKLLAGFFNAIGAACMIGAFVAPIVNAMAPRPESAAFLAVVGLSLHLAAQYILRYIARKE